MTAHTPLDHPATLAAFAQTLAHLTGRKSDPLAMIPVGFENNHQALLLLLDAAMTLAPECGPVLRQLRVAEQISPCDYEQRRWAYEDAASAAQQLASEYAEREEAA